MEKLAADARYKGKVNFLLVNLQGVDKAAAYAKSEGLRGACPHGAGSPGGYGVKYIPHKVLIGKDGLVLKNKDDFQWSDIDAALSASGGEQAMTNCKGSDGFLERCMPGEGSAKGLLQPNFVALEQSNAHVEYSVPILFSLAFLVLMRIGFKKALSFRKPVQGLREPLHL